MDSHQQRGIISLYPRSFQKDFSARGGIFQCITIDKKENIWLGWEDNLISIDASGNILEKMELPGQVFGVWPGLDQTIWLLTENPGNGQLSFWRKLENGTLSPFQLIHNDQPINLQQTTQFVHLNQKGYWFVKIGNQLHAFDQQGKWLYNYQSLVEEGSFTSFFSYFEDEDHFWLTSPTGVLKVELKTNPFQLVHRKEGISSDCRSITEDENGNIYFLNTYLFQRDPLTNENKKISNVGFAYALLYSDSNLWAGTYELRNLGFQIDLRTNEAREYISFNPDKFLVHTSVKTDNPDRFLIGLNKGVAYLDLEKKKVLPFDGYKSNNRKDSLLENSEVNFIHKNRFGFWLATNNGIFLLKLTDGVIRHFHKLNGDLPFNYIRHIHEDKDGFFWLATRGGGIIRWTPPTNFLKGDTKGVHQQLTTEDGLSNNYTYAIYEDDFGKLWIPSDKGLMWMDKKTSRVRTFFVEDGLPHNEFNHTSHFQAKDGTLYFGGLGGLIAFHPKALISDKAEKVPLEFTGFYLMEKGEKKITNKAQLLQESGTIIIRPGDNFFELHFTLLDFDAPQRHTYAYKIEGYSNTWNYIKENFVRITNLPYGKYKLKIQGQNNSRGWSEQELSLDIHVIKPFYLRWWFFLTLFTFIIGLTIFAVFWRTNQLRKDRDRLEKEVKKRTHQVEERSRRIEEVNKTISAQAEALKELDKAKTRFFSNITHELRTPLTLIIGPSEQIITEQPPPKILRRRMSGILKNAQHLLQLINQLLDLSKIEGGKMNIEVTRGDIIAYTRELVDRFRPLTQKKNQRLSFIADHDGWETYFDKDKWDKVIYNLLSNAIKYTPDGQAIQLILERSRKEQNEFIRLDVKDSGLGIERSQLGQIFNRFYQVDSSTTRLQGGAGIGLSMVKELVELQGGEIRVYSEVNKGTTFEIHLPVLKTKKAKSALETFPIEILPIPETVEGTLSPTAKVITPDSQEKLDLLIIEDNEEMREYIRYCIGDSQYNISEASNGEEGIQKAQILIPDLIISDIMMPKKDGFEVTQAIRENISTSHIPLILLTAKTSLESRLKGFQRGADAYLTKPFSPQELSIRIQKLIEIRHLLQLRYKEGLQSVTNDTYRQEDEFIMNLREYILEHIDESNLNGDLIGKHVALSRSHLHRKLKALTGHSITEFIKLVRLEKAMEFIQEGELNISEISYKTGFSSVSHFSRSFKKHFGRAPSKINL